MNDAFVMSATSVGTSVRSTVSGHRTEQISPQDHLQVSAELEMRSFLFIVSIDSG